MLANRFRDDLFQLPDADNISEKKIGDDKSQQKKNDMLQCNQSDLPGIPGCFVQHFLFVGAANDQVFHFPEKHFHKNGLRTNPSAEQPSECRSKEDDEENKSHHHNTKNEKILRPEYFAKQDKFCFGYIKKKQRPPIDLYKWKPKEKQKVTITHVISDRVQLSFGSCGIDPFALSFTVNCSNTVPEAFIYRGWG